MPITSSLLIGIILIGATDEPGELSRADLLAAIRDAEDQLGDVEYLYEGSYRLLVAPDLSKIPEANRNTSFTLRDSIRFQGRFARRSDGLAHLDLYTWQDPASGNPSRYVACLPGDGKLHEQGFHPGGGPTEKGKSRPGWYGDFFQMFYPAQLDLRPYVAALLQRKDSNYKCKGWETIGDRSCLAIEIANPSGSMADEFWIDLERGMLPVRYDERVGQDLRLRVQDVEPVAFPGPDGTPIWLPGSARVLSHVDLGEFTDEPVSEVTIGLVRNSVRIGQGLPDSRFTLRYRPQGGPVPDAWAEAEAEARERARIEVSQSAEAGLAAELAVANQTTRELTATPGGLGAWLGRNATTLMLAAVGALSLSTALYLRFRRG